MEPLNLSSMEQTPAENRAALDEEYQEEIWCLTESFRSQRKAKCSRLWTENCGRQVTLKNLIVFMVYM